MKASLALISAALIASKTYASCFSEELGYPCCSGNNVVFTDDRGKWGVEDRKWCGIADESTGDCWATKLHYPCCTSSDPKVYYTDESGDWSVEHGKWCGIITKKNDSPFYMNGNPFKNIEYYINPYYVEKVDKAISQMTDASLIAKAEKMKTYSNAIWLDSIENMQNWLEVSLKGALAQQQSSSKHVLTVFTVYDLPGRDCHALMSNGELQPKDADMERYKTEFIDVIEEKLKTYNTQPVVLIVEPNSLSQLVTNVETTPACADAEKYYLDGHAYLIKKLGILPNVALYLDIGNALTLGWDDTREAAVKLYANVVKSGKPGIVRGFFDNALQYSPWEDPIATRGPDSEWNPCPDEKRYLEAMYKDLKAAGVKYVNFVSDSAQNGKKIENSDSGNLCIPSGVGIGARPEANPVSGMDYVDAFYWIEPFGETIVDTYDEIDMQYGPNCMKKSPKAGEWFQEYFEQGLKNANPPF